MSDVLDVDPEQRNQLITEAEERINKASSLAFTTQTDGWRILLETFEDMKEEQLRELYRQTPGNDHDILAAHSVWFTTVHVLNEIQMAVSRAIRDGEQAKLDLVQLRQTPDEIDLSI